MEDDFPMRWMAVGLAVVVVVAGVRTAAWAERGSGVEPSVARTLLFCPGSERWSIKTLTDTAATLVDYRHPLVRTVAQLAAQDPAALIPSVKILASTPRLPLERIVYRVKVRLRKSQNQGGHDGGGGNHLRLAH